MTEINSKQFMTLEEGAAAAQLKNPSDWAEWVREACGEVLRPAPGSLRKFVYPAELHAKAMTYRAQQRQKNAMEGQRARNKRWRDHVDDRLAAHEEAITNLRADVNRLALTKGGSR